MRVMLDTNILISALLFKSKLMDDLIECLANKHSIVLCSYVIDELHETVDSKFAAKNADVVRFLLELPFEYVYTPYVLPTHDYFTIRDSDDEKVLYSAIIADVDVLVTGDKDFHAVDIERPEILNPVDFLAKY